MIFLVIFYMIILLLIGIFAELRAKRSGDEYFLAGRSFRPIMLFFTMAATNFSAFFFLGFSGYAYEYGFGEYGAMALGTAFMPVMFYVMGRKVWKLGKEKGYTTAPELIGKETESRVLQFLVMALMIIFTIPYLAVQAAGAGMIISALSDVQPVFGAIIVTAIIGIYVSLGGMRASGWTDVVQGILMFSAMLIAGIFIAMALGGAGSAGEAAYSSHPELFIREGGVFTTSMWFSFIILWIFADPMFPQLFSRFYTAKDEKSLKMTMILYPFLISFLFLIPVLIGVWARGTDVSVESSNTVMIAMVKRYTPSWVFYLVMLGALSALMSTADSQLFSISTMAVKDTGLGKRLGDVKTGMLMTWIIVIGVILYTVYFFNSDSDIMSFLLKNSFSGLVVLSPAFLGTLYWKKMGKIAAILSIIAGELYVIAAWTGITPDTGFHNGIVALFISGIVLISLSYLENLAADRSMSIS